MLSTRASETLQRLGIAAGQLNAGIYDGKRWRKGSGKVLTSYEAATGEVLAQIAPANKEETLQVLLHCREAQKAWRMVPAPKRGDIIRQIRNRLQDSLQDLGEQCIMSFSSSADTVDRCFGISRDGQE